MAIRQYQACRDVLFSELGLSPERETETLAKEIRERAARLGETIDSSPARPSPRADTSSLPDKPSIAVLPFTNLSGDPEQDYFSDGITEDIITELSRFRTLFVIARNSSFTFKGKAIKAQDVGRELGVAYLVEGSVRKADSRVRVTVQLVKSVSGENLWAQRYDRQLKDVFSIQDEITQTIAATIGGHLEAEDRLRASQARHPHLTAYDCVLRAQCLYHQISRIANAEARPLFWNRRLNSILATHALT